MKKKIIKVISVFIVLNIFLIPLSNFAPGNQIKTVQASEGVVDARFYGAVLSMIGITSVLIGNMSQNFSIPSADLIALKDQFAQTLEADASKKSAWMAAQTDYLAGGIAKTMGAVELAKIGVNDIYTGFLNYCKNSFTTEVPSESITSTNVTVDGIVFNISILDQNRLSYVKLGLASNNKIRLPLNQQHDGTILSISFTSAEGYNYGYVLVYVEYGYCKVRNLNNSVNNMNTKQQQYLLQLLSNYCIPDVFNLTGIYGNATNDLIEKTDEYIKVYPTIPWIDTSVPVGTIVTPEIAAPYAGAVPIDVPITAPIDPPIDEPVDPPADATLLGTVAAILAGITPISAILDNILASELDIADVIEVSITGVIDGIGDIASTLTGGITSSLTDIQSSLSTLTAPATETINLDPVKNIPSVLFTKFPFSIPWDLFNVYNLMATDNRSPPEFSLGIPMTKSLNLSAFGVSDINMDIKLENYEEIAGIVRTAELLLFVIGLIFATKKLIWG